MIAASGRVISVNVALPREVEWQGRHVLTSIFKEPIGGRVRVGQTNLEGDEQSDRSVHGGVHKAVYAYPSEHYAFWQAELEKKDLPWGAFGENLTVEGLLETDVRIGDCFLIGTAELTVTQPRMPCFKLGIRYGRPDIVKRFEQAGRSGFYLAVVREGQLGARDEVAISRRNPDALTVAALARLRTAKRPARELLERAASHDGLSPSWREHFHKQLTTGKAP